MARCKSWAALLAAARNALACLEVAVREGGGDPATHIVCVELRSAIAKATGGAS